MDIPIGDHKLQGWPAGDYCMAQTTLRAKDYNVAFSVSYESVGCVVRRKGKSPWPSRKDVL